ncbi:dihydroneopterin aldolase [uncultured Methylibium sp.]|uniref:dihydroneopterin aldolase n=1 Tax=uncultured Methylibium sp. TaxID=381093 RepID=UPI0025EAFE6B|nr:dihydroneopterin aldolase [uncultured Methylibium sp.]
MIAHRPHLQPPLAEPGSDAQPLDLIFIEGFTGQTVIGIHDSELHRPQTIRIDLTAGVPRPRACDTDQIGDTIDYGVVRERLQRLLKEHRLTLLESFAETIAEILLGEFGAHWVRVVVVKPKKFDDVDSVGVAIERRRPAESPGGRGATVLSLIGAGMVPGR